MLFVVSWVHMATTLTATTGYIAICFPNPVSNKAASVITSTGSTAAINGTMLPQSCLGFTIGAILVNSAG